jgi:PleD family two-component response regulator
MRMPTTISIGLSDFPTDATEKDPLLDKADKALYQAKTSGKDKVCTAS